MAEELLVIKLLDCFLDIIRMLPSPFEALSFVSIIDFTTILQIFYKFIEYSPFRRLSSGLLEICLFIFS